jgi:hypothetical protein
MGSMFSLRRSNKLTIEKVPSNTRQASYLVEIYLSSFSVHQLKHLFQQPPIETVSNKRNDINKPMMNISIRKVIVIEPK